MKVFVLNNGSSSAKFQLINTDTEEVLAKGCVEKIGHESRFKATFGEETVQGPCEASDHRAAINLIFGNLVDPNHGVIKSLDEIGGIGHRVVHGGEKFQEAQIITPEVIDGIKECSRFAPLHNPHNLKGIEICSEEMPGKSQVAVFDTAFHSKMSKNAFLYPLPLSVYEKYGIRRYGFHGTSHHFVALKCAEILDRPYDDLKMITCHLGNGCSMAAIRDGVSVDTSMGFTPLEGLMMGTRCGDIDPAIVPYLMEEGMTEQEVTNMMNKKSGLLGISGASNDMREILAKSAEGSKRHQLALEMFCRRVKKYIGAYAALLEGLDAVVFTGGIGENCERVRKMIITGLDYMGVVFDEEANGLSGGRLTADEESRCISAGPVSVQIIATNEELMIARTTVAAISACGEATVECSPA